MNFFPSRLVLVGAYSVPCQMDSPTARVRLTSSAVKIFPYTTRARLKNSKRLNPMAPQDPKPNYHLWKIEEPWLKLIDNSISLLDGHYQMGLLWRDNNPVLPYN